MAETFTTSSFSEPRRTRLPAIAAVVLVHAGLGYALLSGLAGTMIQNLPNILVVTQIPIAPDPKPEPQPVKETPRSNTKQQIERVPPIVDAEVPEVFELKQVPLVPMPRSETSAGTGDFPFVPTPPVPPVAGQATTARATGNRAGWITSEDYPMSALRAEESGTVGIQAAIDASGRVMACAVTQTSGSAALDAAACRLYQKRGRFTPAHDDQGIAVGSTLNDRIRWQLPR